MGTTKYRYASGSRSNAPTTPIPRRITGDDSNIATDTGAPDVRLRLPHKDWLGARGVTLAKGNEKPSAWH
jgi:hypothetical protein